MAFDQWKIARNGIAGCHVKTCVPTSAYNFVWTIENFSKILEKTTVKSAIFEPIPDSVWNAGLVKNLGSFKVYICNRRGTRVCVQQDSTICDGNHKVLHEESELLIYSGKPKSHEVINNFPSERVPELNSLPGDVLIYQCAMEFYGHNIETNAYNYLPAARFPTNNNLALLANDLKSMYSDSLYSDVTLEVGENTLRAHKSILCSRSSVFAKMFATPMAESESNIVKQITDVDLPVLKNLLAFMYTGAVEDQDFEAVYSLYYAADKYDVYNLRETCGDLLLSKLKVDNVCRVLVLADMHSDEELKGSAMNFIQFYFDDILDEDSWEDMLHSSVELVSEVRSLLRKKRKL